MAPSAAVLVHLPAQEFNPGCLQLPHGAGEIVDHEADHGTGGEVLVGTTRPPTSQGAPTTLPAFQRRSWHRVAELTGAAPAIYA